MFIVHTIGSDEENPFKVFTSASDAAKEAEDKAKGRVERVFVYEWTGNLQEGLAAAREGQLEPKMHYSHREAPPVPPPEAPIRLPKKIEELLSERIKKMPKIARKF
jgi:hypothetical protein